MSHCVFSMNVTRIRSRVGFQTSTYFTKYKCLCINVSCSLYPQAASVMVPITFKHITSVNSPMVRVIVTAKAPSIGWEQLNSSVTSFSGSRGSDEWQEVCVSFTPLTVHTAHLSKGSSVETVTIDSLSGWTFIVRHSEGTDQRKCHRTSIWIWEELSKTINTWNRISELK